MSVCVFIFMRMEIERRRRQRRARAVVGVWEKLFYFCFRAMGRGKSLLLDFLPCPSPIWMRFFLNERACPKIDFCKSIRLAKFRGRGKFHLKITIFDTFSIRKFQWKIIIFAKKLQSPYSVIQGASTSVDQYFPRKTVFPQETSKQWAAWFYPKILDNPGKITTTPATPILILFY